MDSQVTSGIAAVDSRVKCKPGDLQRTENENQKYKHRDDVLNTSSLFASRERAWHDRSRVQTHTHLSIHF